MNAQRPRRGSPCRLDRGMTLVELLAVLSILAILLGIGIPGMNQLVASTRANGSMMQLAGMLGVARQGAITSNREVTLCGTSNGTACSNTWENKPTLVFVDSNANRQADADERVILVSDLTRSARIRWKASGNRAYLRYTSDGGVREYGSFIYCPSSGNARHARQLIVSATGRPRMATDSDRDGIIDDGAGNPLQCD